MDVDSLPRSILTGTAAEIEADLNNIIFGSVTVSATDKRQILQRIAAIPDEHPALKSLADDATNFIIAMGGKK